MTVIEYSPNTKMKKYMETINDYSSGYLKYCLAEKGNCLGTIEQKKHALRKITRSCKAPPPQVLAIDQYTVLDLKLKWIEEGLSDSRVALLLSVLKDFLKYLQDFVKLDGVYSYEKVTIPMVKGKKKEYWTEQEIDSFIEPLPEASLKDKRFKALCAVLSASGARIMEVLGIRRDVSIAGREAVVLGKGRCYRKIYWDGRAAHYLRLYQEARPDWDKSEFLFGTVNKGNYSGKWDECDVNRAFRKFSKSVGKRIHCHKFRASFLTNCLHNGMCISAVSKAMGHKDIRTSMRYFSPMSDENTKAEFEKYYSRKVTSEAKPNVNQ